MRWLVCALAMVAALAFIPHASADDFDVLRGMLPVGPALFTNWSGFYFGGQVGYGGAGTDFSRATQEPVAYALRETTLQNEFTPSEWPVLGSAHQNLPNYGAFVGYNSQWQDLIFGAEANYSQMSLSMTAINTPIARRTPADSSGNTYDVYLDGKGSISNLYVGTLRARAGWALGNFLPYGFAGLAVGMANSLVSATVSGVEYPSGGGTPIPFSYTGSVSGNGQVMVGFDVGAGLDIALTPNLFLRGEYEFVDFAPPSGINISVNIARVGAGLKF